MTTQAIMMHMTITMTTQTIMMQMMITDESISDHDADDDDR